MAPAIRGIHLGYSRITNQQQILTVIPFRGDRLIIGASDDDRLIQDHDFIVRPFVAVIEGDRDPSRHQAYDGRDERTMRLQLINIDTIGRLRAIIVWRFPVTYDAVMARAEDPPICTSGWFELAGMGHRRRLPLSRAWL
jgi:hypothetical protein